MQPNAPAEGSSSAADAFLMAHAADIGRQSSLDPDLLLEGVSRQGLLGL
jgi:hypothetical protein